MCPSIWRLCRSSIHYKRWIQTIYKKNNGNDDIQKTTHINIDKNIDDITYKKIFIESKESIENIIKF